MICQSWAALEVETIYHLHVCKLMHAVNRPALHLIDSQTIKVKNAIAA